MKFQVLLSKLITLAIKKNLPSKVEMSPRTVDLWQLINIASRKKTRPRFRILVVKFAYFKVPFPISKH